MLTIRNEQMQALADARTAAFARELHDWLVARLQAQDVSIESSVLDAQIREGCAQARALRLGSERDVAHFIEMVLLRRGGFPESGWPRPALAILSGPGHAAAEKLQRLDDWLRQEETGGEGS